MKIKAYAIMTKGGKAEPFIYERILTLRNRVPCCLQVLLFTSTLNVEFDMDRYLKMLKPQGKFCIVAQPPEKLSISLGLLYDYAQRTIYGNYTGSRKDMTDMIAFSAKHNIESVVEVLPFSKMNEAIEKVRRGALTRLVLENT